MEKINIDKDNIDKYYSIVNGKIDEYFNLHLSPIALEKYFSVTSNLDSFKKKNSLNNVIGIDRIIKDVISDRVSMLSETVQFFNDFRNQTDLEFIFNGIEPANTTVEAVLSDYSHLPMSKITIDNVAHNLYNVGNKKMYCFNQNTFNIIKSNIVEKIYQSILNDRAEMMFIGLSINMSDILDKNALRKVINETVNKIHITKFLSLISTVQYMELYKNHYIWLEKI